MKAICVFTVAALLLLSVPACKQSDSDKAPEATASTIGGNEAVENLSAAMKSLGFTRVSALPMSGETVVAVNEKISADGAEYNFKAIKYTSRTIHDRYAVSSLTKNGAVAPKAEEIKLILLGKIPHTLYGGGWLKPRSHGTAVEFDYGKAKVVIVCTLPDGRVVKHILKEGLAPYFAVESVGAVTEKKAITVTIYPECAPCSGKTGCDAKSNTYPTEEQLAARGNIPAGGKITKIISENKQAVGEVIVTSMTVLVEWPETKKITSMMAYPYEG